MESIFDSQVTPIFQIMTLFNIELFMILGSPVFWPISVSLLPPSRRLCSFLKHASWSSTFILAVHLELMLIYVMHKIFFINLNSQFNLTCMLFYFRHYLCISSCLIYFDLLASFINQYLSPMTSSSNWDYAQAYHVSFTKSLIVTLNSIISWTSLNKC